jgi:transcriptional regulator with XRE-family HTH domain
MSGNELRARRHAAGIPGVLVCRRAAISRSRLSNIERGNISPPPEELTRIAKALDQLIAAKEKINVVAAEVGWPIPPGAAL